jgi:MFS family permease
VALVIGRIYDKIGLRSLIIIPLLTFPIPFFVFSYSYHLAVIGIVLWGAILGIHETTMRAAIADLTPLEHRGFAYGIFNTIYGASWLFGGTLMGVLYDMSIHYIFIFVVFMELISIIAFLFIKRRI